MRAIVIPVKAFRQAKSRLAGCLPDEARAMLARAMCRDLFDTIAKVRLVDRVFVVTSDPCAIGWAKETGWESITESQQVSESISIDAASRHCEASGITALLRIPADIPLVRREDVEEIFAALDNQPAAVIVPSRDGTGTNALLRAQPTAFPSFFGKDSLPRHLAAAKAADVAIRIIDNPRIALDVDVPEDLDLVRKSVTAESHTGRWFNEKDHVRAVARDLALTLQPRPH